MTFSRSSRRQRPRLGCLRVSAAAAAGGVPSLLLGPWGGSIADRVDLRKLLIATQIAFALLAALLWAVVTGWISSAAGPRVALLAGAAACLVAAGIAALVHTPPDPDAALTDLPQR